MKQVSFLWSGCPGVYSRRTVTGDVLETRTSKAGAVEHLVKVELLNLPLWVAAEFCTDVPVEKPEPVAAPLWTPRKWLITSAAARARRLHLDGYMALEEVVAEWRQQQRFTAACAYYAGVNDRAHTRLIGDVERHAGIEKAAHTAEAMQTA